MPSVFSRQARVAHCRTPRSGASRISSRVVKANWSAQTASFLAAGVLLVAQPSLAVGTQQVPAPEQPSQTTTQPATPPAVATAITFTRIDPDRAQKVKQQDEMAAWKCTGASMYDCDGERAAAAEKFWDEVTSGLRPK